jgi:hypothetical protein
MKSLLLMLFCILISNTLIAQGITKHGSNTASSTYFVSNNGKLGSTIRLDKYGKISDTSFSCGNTLTINHKATNGVAPIDATIYYGTVVSSLTGSPKCWITCNLGASSMAGSATDTTAAAAGWYWQFNRKKGYIGSATSNADWLTSIMEYSSVWASGEDPCALELGFGWRIPNDIEWKDADANGQVGGWDNPGEAWADVLKLHAAGFLLYNSGKLLNRGNYGFYWSSTQSANNYGRLLNINVNDVVMDTYDKAFGFSVRCVNDNFLPTVSSPMVSGFSGASDSFSATISSAGVPAVTTTGFVIGDDTKPNPTIADNIQRITGTLSSYAFTGSATGLTAGKQYYVKAYATNANGTVYGDKVWFVPFSCGNTLTINHKAANGVAPIDATINYGTVVSSLTGSPKCWITRNLGASSMAVLATDSNVAAAGWYWQFNRKKAYIGVLNTSISGWNSTIEDGPWQQAKDPCYLELGAGWRIPTSDEWADADRNGQVGGWTDYDETWADVLKLHAAGTLNYSNGKMINCGGAGYYSSSTSTAILYFNPAYSVIEDFNNMYGNSVRCLRD